MNPVSPPKKDDAIKPDTKYTCTIVSATLAKSTRKGTDALDVEVEITEGDCAGVRTIASLWLKEDTRDWVSRTLQDLGLSEADIASEAFWRNPTALLAERACSIVTKTDDGGDVRVRYLNGPSRSRNRPAKDPAAAAKRAAGLFADDPGRNFLSTEDDVPF